MTERVFAVEGTHELPAKIQGPPEFWRERYGQLAVDLELSATTLEEAGSMLQAFWSRVLEAGIG